LRRVGTKAEVLEEKEEENQREVAQNNRVGGKERGRAEVVFQSGRLVSKKKKKGKKGPASDFLGVWSRKKKKIPRRLWKGEAREEPWMPQKFPQGKKKKTGAWEKEIKRSGAVNSIDRHKKKEKKKKVVRRYYLLFKSKKKGKKVGERVFLAELSEKKKRGRGGAERSAISFRKGEKTHIRFQGGGGKKRESFRQKPEIDVLAEELDFPYIFPGTMKRPATKPLIKRREKSESPTIPGRKEGKGLSFSLGSYKGEPSSFLKRKKKKKKRTSRSHPVSGKGGNKNFRTSV